MDEVYQAEDKSLEQQVALKFLWKEAADNPALSRMRREVRVARKVTHANVCRVHDIGEAEGVQFLSMEFVKAFAYLLLAVLYLLDAVNKAQ